MSSLNDAIKHFPAAGRTDTAGEYTIRIDGYNFLVIRTKVQIKAFDSYYYVFDTNRIGNVIYETTVQSKLYGNEIYLLDNGAVISWGGGFQGDLSGNIVARFNSEILEETFKHVPDTTTKVTVTDKNYVRVSFVGLDAEFDFYCSSMLKSGKIEQVPELIDVTPQTKQLLVAMSKNGCPHIRIRDGILYVPKFASLLRSAAGTFCSGFADGVYEFHLAPEQTAMLKTKTSRIGLNDNWIVIYNPRTRNGYIGQVKRADQQWEPPAIPLLPSDQQLFLSSPLSNSVVQTPDTESSFSYNGNECTIRSHNNLFTIDIAGQNAASSIYVLDQYMRGKNNAAESQTNN